jgi:hypothetical protein
MPEWEWWADDAAKWPRYQRWYWRREVPSYARFWLMWAAATVVFAVLLLIGLLVEAAA